MTHHQTDPRQRRFDVHSDAGRAALLVTLGALALLLAAYVGVAFFAGGRVPDGTRVGGVDLGGLSADAAKAKLTRAVAARDGERITLTGAGRSATVDPADAGLGIDIDASLAGLTGFSLAPQDVLARLGRGEDRALTVTHDEVKLTTAVERAAGSLDVAPKEGAIAIEDGVVRYTAPVTGRSVDVGTTTQSIIDNWPRSAPLPATMRTTPPKVSAESMASAKAFADRAVSGPVRVTAGTASFDVSPSALGTALSFAYDGKGGMAPKIDTKALVAAVHRAAASTGLEKAAKDATVRFTGATFAVVPSQTGVAIDDAVAGQAVTTAMSSQERTAAVTTTVTKPSFTTEQARATLPTGQISTFTTKMVYTPENYNRVHNIQLAGRIIDGTYIPPGARFDMNKILGQRTLAKGYKMAHYINQGQLANTPGGGISQVSTTIFNAAFFSGMKFIEYSPHAYYISRYPEGREATISWPDLDHIWVNTTDGGALIKIATTNTSITVTFYGRKKWDIEATKSPRRNVVQPKEIRKGGASCVPQSPNEGFDVTVGRIFKQGAAVVKRESFSTHYIASDHVICTDPRAQNN